LAASMIAFNWLSVPVKAALTMMGLIEEHYRLPLLPLDDDKRQAVRRTLAELGLL
jgi:4-hydroxy-tetrahydrodipicolinate synthase